MKPGLLARRARAGLAWPPPARQGGQGTPAAKPRENPAATRGEPDTKAGNAKTEQKDPPVSEVAVEEKKPKVEAPDWLTSVRLVSDLRMRLDVAYAPDSDFVTRWRMRPRLRLGAIATLKDDWAIGFRLASTPTLGKDSGGDSLSTNQTFEDNASRKPVGVDWAFARWTPIHTPKVTGSFALGKLENPPNFTEDVFDVDYTPVGFAEQFS